MTLPRAPWTGGLGRLGSWEGLQPLSPQALFMPWDGSGRAACGALGWGGRVLGSSTGTPAATLQRRATAWGPRSLVPLLFSSDALLILRQMMMPKISTSAAEGVRTRTSRFGVLGGEKRVLLPFCVAPSAALCPGEGFCACS